MADLLVAEGVRKEFGGLLAVNDVDFIIPDRSIVSLIGPNGAGKTTFFNMLTGVYHPTAGKIVFAGDDVTDEDAIRALRAHHPRAVTIRVLGEENPPTEAEFSLHGTDATRQFLEALARARD